MANCLAQVERQVKSCSEYADQGHEDCARTRDEGREDCAEWRDEGDNACDGWSPLFSWLCVVWVWVSNFVCVAWIWVANVVCVAWTWVSNVVCVAWTYATAMVCVLWDVATTILGVLVDVLEAAIGWVASAIAFLFELILSMPFLGRPLRWLVNILTTAFWGFVGLTDSAAYMVGIRPQKKLRVCTIVLRDERGTPLAPVANVVAALNDAIDIWLKEANVQILNSAAGQFSSGLASRGRRADESWVRVDDQRSTAAMLDLGCDAAGRREDLSVKGTLLQFQSMTTCFLGNWRRVTGYGAPIVIFVVRSIEGNKLDGCGLGPLTDYVTVSGAGLSPGGVTGPNTLIAHEIGHVCNLWHTDDDPPNLMYTAKGPTDHILRTWQEVIARASRHVSYL